MASKRMKRRTRSCKNGKLKRPVRTKNGGKRRCRKSKRKSRRKNKIKSYKMKRVSFSPENKYKGFEESVIDFGVEPGDWVLASRHKRYSRPKQTSKKCYASGSRYIAHIFNSIRNNPDFITSYENLPIQQITGTVITRFLTDENFINGLINQLENQISENNREEQYKPNNLEYMIYTLFKNEIMIRKLKERMRDVARSYSNNREKFSKKFLKIGRYDLKSFKSLYESIMMDLNAEERAEVEMFESDYASMRMTAAGAPGVKIRVLPDSDGRLVSVPDPIIRRFNESDEQFKRRQKGFDEDIPNLQTFRRRRHMVTGGYDESLVEFRERTQLGYNE